MQPRTDEQLIAQIKKRGLKILDEARKRCDYCGRESFAEANDLVDWLRHQVWLHTGCGRKLGVIW